MYTKACSNAHIDGTSRNWSATTFAYKKSIFRIIRDVVDPSEFVEIGEIFRRKKKIFKSDQQIPSPETIKSSVETFKEKVDSSPQKEECKIIPLYRQKKNDSYNSINISSCDIFIPKYSKDDYNNSYQRSLMKRLQITSILPTAKLVTKLIEVPVPKIKKRYFDVRLPVIRFNMRNLRKIGFLSLITCCSIVVIIAAILFYRGIQFMDGDFIGSGYRYKIAQFEKDLVIPLSARLEVLESDVRELKAHKDAQDYNTLVNKLFGKKKSATVIKDPITKKILKVEEITSP